MINQIPAEWAVVRPLLHGQRTQAKRMGTLFGVPFSSPLTPFSPAMTLAAFPFPSSTYQSRSPVVLLGHFESDDSARVDYVSRWKPPDIPRIADRTRQAAIRWPLGPRRIRPYHAPQSIGASCKPRDRWDAFEPAPGVAVHIARSWGCGRWISKDYS